MLNRSDGSQLRQASRLFLSRLSVHRELTGSGAINTLFHPIFPDTEKAYKTRNDKPLWKKIHNGNCFTMRMFPYCWMAPNLGTLSEFYFSFYPPLQVQYFSIVQCRCNLKPCTSHFPPSANGALCSHPPIYLN